MSKEEYAVEVENISKIYTLRNKNNQYKTDKKEFYALKDVSFKVKKGDVVGILGTNGSGKSTLSLLLSGISEINSGTMKINGEQALIAINTGLNQQLTGLENINVKGALMGLRKKRIQEITNDVIDFAELGDFLYQPVKKYSSGMKSRLGFSISLALNPDIFIVDEALSVGDKGFAKKCMKRMMKLRDEEGKTIFFISHSLSQVREFCKTGMWIEGGQLVEMGDINKVCDDYSVYVDKLEAMSKRKEKFLDEKFEKRLLPKKKKRVSQNYLVNKGVYGLLFNLSKIVYNYSVYIGRFILMKTVITYGTFDLFHVGHLNLLRRAKELGDYLIVAVSSDEFNLGKNKVCKIKDTDRMKIVEAIKYVDKVIPETSWEQKIEDVKKYNVDVFVMGDDWKGKFDFLKDYCEVVYLPRTEGISTTQLKEELKG